jgi:hypothetical protein
VIAGIAGFYYYQRNIYSKEVLKLEILGPEEVNLAEEIEYIVKYKNNGNTRLESPRLIFEYPENSLVEDSQFLRREIQLEDIYPGEEQTLSFKGRLFGREGEGKTAKAWLSYRPKGLSARYESSTTLTTVIKKVPLTLEFDLPSKIESGKEVRFRLNYFSNADYPLSGLRIKVNYPPGFEFQSSDPAGIEDNEWEGGLLNKAEGGRIEITGRLRGEISEQKIFSAELGSWQQGEFVLLKEASRGVEIVRPQLYILQQINGNPKYVASPGELLHYEIFFKNLGQDPLTDLSLLATLKGEAFDFQTIQAPEADYEPGDNSIIWDWRRVGDLQFLPSQQEGKIEFWIMLKESWPMTGQEDENPVIRNKIYLSQAQEEFLTKINSKLELSQKSYFEDEIFGNSGPLPPKVGESTTYTVIWQAKNYYNDVKNVKVKAVLPKNVELTGRIFPQEQAERFTFDSGSRELVWNIGDLEAGRGVLSSAPNIAFQIAVTPLEGQGGRQVELVGEAEISGEDSWTGKNLKTITPALSVEAQ